MNGRPLVLPAALIFLAGALLVYFALHGWDAKYRLFGGKLAAGSTSPGGTTPPAPHGGKDIGDDFFSPEGQSR